MRRWWSRIWYILTIRCEQASVLQSDSLDRRLRLDERLALRGHLLVCRVCRKLKQQLTFLDSANRAAARSEETESCQLSQQATERIQQHLRERVIGKE